MYKLYKTCIDSNASTLETKAIEAESTWENIRTSIQ